MTSVHANVVESSPSVESGISVGSSRFETIPSSPPDAGDSDGATAAAGESVKHPAADLRAHMYNYAYELTAVVK